MALAVAALASAGFVGLGRVSPAAAGPGSAATATQAGASGTLLSPEVGLYPRVIRLSHSVDAKRTLVASDVTFDGNTGLGAIWASHDNGASFTRIGTVADPAAANGNGLCCSSIYELPRRVGAMPAGTLLWTASEGQSTSPRQMSIRIWQSRDDGRTWSYLATPAVAPNTLGMWEPELTVSADGRLVVFFSDETDQPTHSQMLDEATSADGVTWSQRVPVVASSDPAARPGMANVRLIPRPGSGPRREYLMTYEVCGGSYDCAIHYRVSADGVNWGDPTDLGAQITAANGQYFVHTPTIAWTAGAQRQGRLFLVGQILDNSDGSVAADNGAAVMVSDHGPGGPWSVIPAPVTVPDPYDNYCPNYSSSLLPLAGGTRLLEIATAYDSDQVCKAYFATARG
jgi:hypothetical protein